MVLSIQLGSGDTRTIANRNHSMQIRAGMFTPPNLRLESSKQHTFLKRNYDYLVIVTRESVGFNLLFIIQTLLIWQKTKNTKKQNKN